MHPSTADLRIVATKPLVAPAALEKELPLDDARAELVARSRREVEAIITGSDASGSDRVRHFFSSAAARLMLKSAL